MVSRAHRSRREMFVLKPTLPHYWEIGKEESDGHHTFGWQVMADSHD